MPLHARKTTITIRPEQPEDRATVFEVNQLAFARDHEARLVDRLRETAGPSNISLVAEINKQVVGHVLFSPIVIEGTNSQTKAIALAPLAVHPRYQYRGIGTTLVRDGLTACRRAGHRIVIVLGHPDYYSRFGFASATDRGVHPPFEIQPGALMALELVPGSLTGVSGIVRYRPAFDEV